jgi:hypothetical protein
MVAPIESQHGFDPYRGAYDTGSLAGDLVAKAAAQLKAKALAAGNTEAVKIADNAIANSQNMFKGGSLGSTLKSVGKAAGGAVSSVGKTVAKVASAPESLALKAVAKTGVLPKGVAKIALTAVAPGLAATTQGGQVAASTLNTIAHPNIKNLAANAQLALKNAGPAGLVASGAIGAMQAGLSGKNLESIAWAAAEGAAPAGIDTAIKAAEAIRHGGNILTNALSAASASFTPGSPEAFGFDSAIATLKKEATKAALGAARSALPSEGARRAFDAAVGVVSQGAKGIPDMSVLVKRAGGIPNIVVQRVTNKLSAVPSATKAVLDAVTRNPTLLASNRQMLAQAMRTNAATVNDALKLATSNGKPLLPWRSMQPHVVAFIRKYVPNAPLTALRHAHTNVGGLDATGTTYIVEKGDGPWVIAQKLSGNGNNWKMLLDYNKDKKPTVDKNVWVGEVLNLPPSWQKPINLGLPNPMKSNTLPSVPAPTIAPAPNVVTQVTQAATSIVPSILQAKAILAAWGKTDGINQGGLTDYGLNAADMSTTMGPRDTMMLQSFQNWDNKTLGDGLPVDGNLDSKSLTALQAWATARATAAASSPTVNPSTSVGLPQVNASSDNSVVPTVIPAGVIGGTDSSTKPATPAVASAAKPATGGGGGLIAGGAILGGLLWGIPGALIGGAAGAAIS